MDHPRDPDILRKGFDEYARFVNPLIAERARLAGEPIRVLRAEDGMLTDADGRAIEDFHGTQAFGHRHPAITRAVQEFLESEIPSWYPSRVSPHAGRLARRLCERTGYSSVFFTCTGSDAVEASLKLARAATYRPGILCLEGGYHGCGFGSTALMAAGPFRDPFGPHLPGVRAIPFGDSDALARELTKGDVGAVVVEPIQGEGGVRRLPEPFVIALCELTQRHDALLVADEIQTGLARSGRLLFTETWPRRPEVVLLGKALGGGLIPISAMLTRQEVWRRAYGRDFENGESHNTTFSYNAMGAVAALATLDLLTEELILQVREVGETFRRELAEALAGCPLLEEIRGQGLMIGVKLHSLDHPWLNFEHFGFPELEAEGRSTIGPLLCHRLYRRGFFCFTCGHDWSVFRLQPRFFIPPEKLRAFATACREELDYLCRLI